MPVTDIRCVCLDVDGVLTDGRVYIDNDGRPTRAFHVRDGLAIRWFQKLGGTVAIVTGKTSAGVEARARELDIRHVVQGSEDKLRDLMRVLAAERLTLAQTAVIGDDLPELPLMHACGYSIAVADAVEEVRAAARWVTRSPGGRGAVREALQHLLRESGQWPIVIDHYAGQATRAETD